MLPKPNSTVAANAMIGTSPQMRAVRDTIRRAAGGSATVLIRGESAMGMPLSRSSREEAIGPLMPAERSATGTPTQSTRPSSHASWVAAFHAGEPDILRSCYEDHFAMVWREVGRVLNGADRETLVHEVFFRVLFSGADERRRFRGGVFGSWLATVARNQAIDFARRVSRERPFNEAAYDNRCRATLPDVDHELDFARLMRHIREHHLPPKWRPVFDARFLRNASQREAAAQLGVNRTTLAYQEMRIRRLLRRILLQKRNA